MTIYRHVRRRAAMTLVETLLALSIAVMGTVTMYGYMSIVRARAVWVICDNAGMSAAMDDLNAAMATPMVDLQAHTNRVRLYFSADVFTNNSGLYGNLSRFVDYPEGTNTYAVVRSQVVWFFPPYHSYYTNWLVSYVFP